MQFRIIALTCALAVPVAAVGDDLIRLALSMDAHRCCASTGGKCAQLSGPDDCCQTQQQAASQGFSAVALDGALRIASAESIAVASASQIAIVPVPLLGDRPASTAFKRLHDPPHLHSSPLLI
jgi:hypothetical protein